jgi:hypothetical protein
MKLVFVGLLFVIIISTCSRAKNYKTANIKISDVDTFLVLKGERIPIKHDIGSVFSDETYKDSLIIKIPSLRNGKILGSEIPVKEGYYKYQGYLQIKGKDLQVRLEIINTDDNKIVPETFNGDYVIEK